MANAHKHSLATLQCACRRTALSNTCALKASVRFQVLSLSLEVLPLGQSSWCTCVMLLLILDIWNNKLSALKGTKAIY